MGLYDRIVGEEEPKIPVHQFMALISERHRGQVDREDIAYLLNLAISEMEEFDTILDKMDSLSADRRFEFGRMIHDITLLTESGLLFTDSFDFYRRIDEFI